LRAASPDADDNCSVLHEQHKAIAITANEILFNMVLSPVELLIE
jgi:hypothetical protein